MTDQNIVHLLHLIVNYKKLIGSSEKPLILTTAPGSSVYTVHVAEKDGIEILVCAVGRTILHYDIRCVEDLHAMLKSHGAWMMLGSKAEKQEAKEGTVEHWARSTDNPIGGWYGLRKGYRGRLANYIPPLMEKLGLAEITHEKRNNSMRAI